MSEENVSSVKTDAEFRLSRVWLALFLLDISVLVHFLAYSANRPASRVFLLFGVVLTFLLVLTGVALWISRSNERLEHVRSMARPFRPLAYPLCIIGLLAYGYFQRPEWITAHLGLALAATAVLGLVTFFPNLQLRLRILLIGALVTLSLIVGIRLNALSVTPSVHPTDEGWDLSWAVSYLQTGQVSDILMLGVNGVPTYYVPRISLLLAGWLHVFGIGLWQARLFSVAVAVVAAAFTFFAARNLFDRRTAFLAAAAILASAVLAIGFRIRHDLGLTLAISISLWLYSRAQKDTRLVWHILAGLAIGFGMFAHYHALVLAPVVWVGLYLPRYVTRLRSGQKLPERAVIGYGLGMLCGLAIVVSVQVLPDIESFLLNRSPRNVVSFQQFWRVFVGYGEVLAAMSYFEAVLITLGLLSAVWSRRLLDWTFVLIVLMGHIALSIVTTGSIDYYLVPLVPIYALLIARLLARIVSGLHRYQPIAPAWFALLFLLPATGETLRVPIRHIVDGGGINPPTPAPVLWVQENVPINNRVLGENYYYLWLYDYEFVSPELAGHLPLPERQDYRLAADRWDPALWDLFEIDIVIIDPSLPTFGILRSVVDTDYLASRGFQEVAQFPSRDEHVIRIFRRE